MACKLIETSNAAAKAVAPGARLPDLAETALRDALDAENHVGARYAAFVAKHGEVAPFAKLLKAERRHAAALVTLMKAYGLPVPRNDWGSDGKPVDMLPDDLEAACAASAEARAADVRRYDEVLIPAVSGFPGLVEVFSASRDRARDRHLPAFRLGRRANPACRNCTHSRTITPKDTPMAVAGITAAARAKQKETDMWYFAWMLGLPLAALFAVLNAMWLEMRTDACFAEEGDCPVGEHQH